MYTGPGRYRHYKGGVYEVLGIGVHEHAKENQPGFDPNLIDQHYVVYRPLTSGGLLDGTPTDFWIRGRKNFDSEVDGAPRFLLIPDRLPRSHTSREALDDLRMREDHERRR
jgi:hypothetical protein